MLDDLVTQFFGETPVFGIEIFLKMAVFLLIIAFIFKLLKFIKGQW